MGLIFFKNVIFNKIIKEHWFKKMITLNLYVYILKTNLKHRHIVRNMCIFVHLAIYIYNLKSMNVYLRFCNSLITASFTHFLKILSNGVIKKHNETDTEQWVNINSF